MFIGPCSLVYTCFCIYKLVCIICQSIIFCAHWHLFMFGCSKLNSIHNRVICRWTYMHSVFICYRHANAACLMCKVNMCVRARTRNTCPRIMRGLWVRVQRSRQPSPAERAALAAARRTFAICTNSITRLQLRAHVLARVYKYICHCDMICAWPAECVFSLARHLLSLYYEILLWWIPTGQPGPDGRGQTGLAKLPFTTPDSDRELCERRISAHDKCRALRVYWIVSCWRRKHGRHEITTVCHSAWSYVIRFSAEHIRTM